jgi:serine/threonine-protein kinase
MSVKSYVNQSGDQALNELTEAGFEAEIQYQYSDTVPRGAVITQIPGSDQPLPKGSKIVIIVSDGSEFVFVPNVLGKTLEEARDILTDAGLKPDPKTSGSATVKKIFNINPKEGTKVKRGSTVQISAR